MLKHIWGKMVTRLETAVAGEQRLESRVWRIDAGEWKTSIFLRFFLIFHHKC